MPVIQAFFDESGSHSGSPVLCVAGYAFEKRQARLLTREWSCVLREYQLPYFHMVDCAHGNGPFSALSPTRRIKVATSLIGIIKRRSAQGFAVSVDPKAYQEIMPEWGPTKTPYAFCARCIIDEIGRWFHQTQFNGKSYYYFETGHCSRSEASSVVASVLENPFNRFRGINYGYAGHSFVEKADFSAVQAADILAWQWATDMKHELKGRPRRKDFESLLLSPVRGAHFDRKRLIDYVSILKEFGVDSKHERTTEEELARMLYIRERSRTSMAGLPHRS